MALQQQLVSSKSLLESRAHERITRTRLVQDPEMDPEEAEVNDERPNDESANTSKEVRVEVILERQ